jgi:hypothetical protein
MRMAQSIEFTAVRYHPGFRIALGCPPWRRQARLRAICGTGLKTSAAIRAEHRIGVNAHEHARKVRGLRAGVFCSAPTAAVRVAWTVPAARDMGERLRRPLRRSRCIRRAVAALRRRTAASQLKPGHHCARSVSNPLKVSWERQFLALPCRSLRCNGYARFMSDFCRATEVVGT